MKISLGSWAFSFGPYADHPIAFEPVARRLAEAGYDGIEICGFPPHITLERYAGASDRAELARFLRDLNLGISGYAADLTAANPVSTPQQKYLDLFARNCELCAAIGSPAIRVDTVAAPDSIAENEYRSAFQRVADIWRAAAVVAEEHGVRMVWEFEPGFAFNKPSEVVAMHDAVGHPNFGIMFDTSHAYMCGVVGARQHGTRETLPGGVSEFLEKLKGRIGAIHVIDSDGTLHNNETSTHRPFGEGRIDFRTLAPQLLAVPGMEWWCVDLCFWPQSWELLEPSRAFAASLIEEGGREARTAR